MSDQGAAPEDFALEAGDASISRDSALQYVAVDILEAGGDTDAQEGLLEPVEAEIREHWEEVARDAISAAFIAGPTKGAETAIREIRDRLEYQDVPDEHRDEVRTAVEKRLDQKRHQLEDVFDEILTDAQRRAMEDSEQAVVEWGPVV